MLRNAIVVLAIVLAVGTSGLSTSAFARNGHYDSQFGGGRDGTPARPMPVTTTAPAVCIPDSAATAAAMCGATGAPTMGPWFPRIEPRRCSNSTPRNGFEGDSPVSVLPVEMWEAGHAALVLANGSLNENTAPRWRFSAQMSPP
jgi:hypothetical protein